MSMYEVYVITCSVNGKVYVGYTKRGALVRFREHLDSCRSTLGALARAMVKHGKDAFSHEVLWSGKTHAEACAEERRFIADLNCMVPNGYNLTYGGDGVPLTREQYDASNAKRRGVCSPKMRAWANRQKGIAPVHLIATLGHAKGTTWSAERRAKCETTWARKKLIKLGLLETPVSPTPAPVFMYERAVPTETVFVKMTLPSSLVMTKAQRRFARRYAAGLIKSLRRPVSDETKDRIRKGHLGKVCSEATKVKLRAANLGKLKSAETIEKHRISSSGRTHSAETREKMSAAQKGRKVSPEAIAKLKLALTGRKRDPELIRRQKETWVRKRLAKQLSLTCLGGHI